MAVATGCAATDSGPPAGEGGGGGGGGEPPKGGRRELNIVAHQDDDLIFMNPDIQRSIRSGNRVCTAFVTASERKEGAEYWRAREAGILDAYAAMAGVRGASWTRGALTIAGKRARLFTLDEAPQVSVVFLRIVDELHPGPSVEELFRGAPGARIEVVPDVDVDRGKEGSLSTTHSREELIDVLGALLEEQRPALIRGLDPSGRHAPNVHADHIGTALFTVAAQRRYRRDHAFQVYRDYNVSLETVNLSPEEIEEKLRVFGIYNCHDRYLCRPGTCDDPEPGCRPSGGYLEWNLRQYAVPVTTGPIVAPDGACLTASPGDGEVRLDACEQDDAAQRWTFLREGAHEELGGTRTGGEIRWDDDLCLGTPVDAALEEGARVGLHPCRGVERGAPGIAERWSLEEGRLRDAERDRCLVAAGGGVEAHLCTKASGARWRLGGDGRIYEKAPPHAPPRRPPHAP